MSDLSSLALRLAGQNAYEKGISLQKQGAVDKLVVDLPKIIATVQGTITYEVELTLVSDTIEGSCNCPASEGFDFCKHCVAALISYDEQCKAFDKIKEGDPSTRLKAYLDLLSEREIKDAFYKQLLQSSELFEYWLLLADLKSQKISSIDLKKYVTKALPLKDIWKHDKVRDYFSNASKALMRLFNAVETIDVESQLQFCEFTLARYDKILERIDDSGGHRFGVFTLLEKKHADTFRRLNRGSKEKAEYLMALYDAPYNHIEFTGLPAKYIGEEDKDVESVFYMLLKAWVDEQIQKLQQKVKVSSAIALKVRAQTLVHYLYEHSDYKLALYYSTQVATDIEDYFNILALAVKAEEFTIAAEYLQLLQQGSTSAEAKLKVERFACEVYSAKNDLKRALQHSWNVFEITHKISDIQTIQALAARLTIDKEVVLFEAEKLLLKHIRLGSVRKNTSEHLRTIETLAELYLLADLTDKALALSQQYDLPNDTVHEIAQASLAKRPKASFNLYRQLCLLYPQLGSPKDYEICVELLLELDKELNNQGLWSEKFNHLLAELFDIFSHKETFIALLQRHFPNARH